MVSLLHFISDTIIGLLVTGLFIYIILDLLIAFNVINYHNQFVKLIHQALASVFEPMLRPFRNLLPRSTIDFSPILLFILLEFLRRVVINDWLVRLVAG